MNLGFSGLVPIPETKRVIIDSGIGLFELRKTRIYDNTQKDFGYWDVRAYEETDINLRMSYRHRWYTSDTAYVEFIPNKKGIATAFCPDDEIWHNRVMLACNMSDGNFTIEGLHTREGSLNAKIARLHIVCLRNYLFTWVVKDTVSNKRLFESKLKDECDRFAADTNNDNLRVDLEKIEPIEKLIRQFKAGWMQSPQFQNEIRPEVQKIIDEKIKNEKPTAATVGMSILEHVRNLTSVEREALRDALFAGEPVGNSDNITKTEDNLANKSMPQIMTFAKAKGVKVQRGMKKEEILEAIKAKIIEDKNKQLEGMVDNENPLNDANVGSPYDGYDEEVKEIA